MRSRGGSSALHAAVKSAWIRRSGRCEGGRDGWGISVMSHEQEAGQSPDQATEAGRTHAPVGTTGTNVTGQFRTSRPQTQGHDDADRELRPEVPRSPHRRERLSLQALGRRRL